MVRTYVGRRVEKMFSNGDDGSMAPFGGEVVGYDMEVKWFKVLRVPGARR